MYHRKLPQGFVTVSAKRVPTALESITFLALGFPHPTPIIELFVLSPQVAMALGVTFLKFFILFHFQVLLLCALFYIVFHLSRKE